VLDVADTLSSHIDVEAWALPLPGHGRTALRHLALCELGRSDLALARIAEAHTDALAILAEADHVGRSGALYGVWASDGRNSQLRAERSRGRWRLNGLKQYCSGASFATDALVTAHHGEGIRLFEVSLDAPGVRVEPSTWANPAMSDTATCPVSFESVSIEESAVLGESDWYLQRPGFWHGAVGPAACWAGGALSLIDAARRLNRPDPHSRAHLGALEAAAWSLMALLDTASAEIDGDPMDRNHNARRRALMVRHLIERTCTEVLDRFGRATGPQLLAFDHQVAKQHAALSLYIRQCHAERDLEVIAAAAAGPSR
jgi:alkylation response protein AidB-like acyl-CoA dehydrogenase